MQQSRWGLLDETNNQLLSIVFFSLQAHKQKRQTIWEILSENESILSKIGRMLSKIWENVVEKLGNLTKSWQKFVKNENIVNRQQRNVWLQTREIVSNRVGRAKHELLHNSIVSLLFWSRKCEQLLSTFLPNAIASFCQQWSFPFAHENKCESF